MCSAALIGVACACASPARGANWDLSAGRSVTGPAAGQGIDAATVAFLTVGGTNDGGSASHFSPIATLGYIGSHHTSRGDLNRSVVLAGAGARYRFWRRMFVSEQVVATSTRTVALSSRFEFMTTLGIQVGPALLMARHVSNAHLVGGGPNHGETMLLVGLHL